MIWLLALISWSSIGSTQYAQSNAQSNAQFNTQFNTQFTTQFNQMLDVTCLAPNCWQSGWTISDQYMQYMGSARCLHNNCQFEGWDFTWPNGARIHIVCKPNGCFIDGWVEKDDWGRVVDTTTCYRSQEGQSDCMRWGWQTLFGSGESITTQCINEDCNHNGWESIALNGQRQRTLCKERGCMEQGWTISQ